MLEAQRVAAFIWTTLTADSGPGGVNTLLNGRIYRDLVPQAVPLPAATVAVISGTDSNTLGGIRAFDAVLVDVRVIGSGASYGTINPIADRIDAVLQNRSGINGGVVVVELRREQVMTLTESEAGAVYSHLIQTYRTEAHASP